MIACLPLMLTSLLAPADTLPPFPTGVYWPTERLPWVAEQAGKAPEELQGELLRRLRDEHHCNTVWLVNGGTSHWQAMLTQAAEARVTLLPTPEQVIWVRQTRDPREVDRHAAAAVEALGSYPALGAYVLIDEARTPEMAQMEALRAAFARHDSTRPQVMVLMARDLEAGALRTRVPILCADPYPFFGPNSPNGPSTPLASRGYYRQVVRHLVSLCESTGKTPWVMPQMFSDVWGPWHYGEGGTVVMEAGAYHHWRTPTLGETRWEIWEAVGQGAKGVLFYVLFPPKNERRGGEPYEGRDFPAEWPRVEREIATELPRALLTPAGEATPHLAEIGRAFADLERLGPDLLRYRSSPATLAVTDAPWTIHTLQDPATGEALLAVINDDPEQAIDGVVRPLVEGVAATELRSGRRFEPGEWRLRLEGGDGALLQLETAEPRWTLLFEEDFTIANPGVALSGLTPVRTRAAYGIGWLTRVEPEGDAPGTVTANLDQVAGKAERARLRIWAAAEGAGELTVEATVDGETFGPLAPSLGLWEIPAEATALRVTVPAGGRLARLVLTGVVR